VFHFFLNEKDYALTLWFHESICTKREVDRFFRNKRLFSSHEDLNYFNDEKWLKQFDKIFFDIQSNTWVNAKIKLNSAEKNKIEIVVHVQYQDIIQVIRFFIEHKSFETNLTYVFVRQYNDNDERIYNEMHIDIWWWKKQKQLFEKTIIISLIIITNKTMFIEHHDDKTAWSMYLIIDNLNRSVRRSQTRSKSVFFDFISIIKSSESSDKIRIWHHVMSLMFKRKFTFICSETWLACSTLMSL
jgi:ribosome-associated translation inhibitor RaiA